MTTPLQRLMESAAKLNRIPQEGVFPRLSVILLAEILNELREANGKPPIEDVQTELEEQLRIHEPDGADES